MPHTLPDVAETFKVQMPATHKLWWIRGFVMHSEQMPSADDLATAVPKIITKVQVFDIDSEEGHEMMLMGANCDFAEGDVVSLFGHELSSARNPTTARLILNHNTGNYYRAYPEDLFDPNTWHFAEFKHRLSCRTDLNLNQKIMKFAVIFGVFFLSVGITFGITLVLLVVSLAFGVFQHLLSLWATPTFSGQKRETQGSSMLKQLQDYLNTKYQNVMPIYEHIADTMNVWVFNNPDKEKKFVAVPRRNEGRGRLVE